jgi:hypothetical protein
MASWPRSQAVAWKTKCGSADCRVTREPATEARTASAKAYRANGAQRRSSRRESVRGELADSRSGVVVSRGAGGVARLAP